MSIRFRLAALGVALAGCGSGSGLSITQSIGQNTCDPALAIGATTPAQKAMLDTIAFTEGTRGHGEDGYNVTFGYHYFSDCNQHPRIAVCEGQLCSDAAGRYQFLSTTWDGLGLANFHPDNQDRGALELIAQRIWIPSDRPLDSSEFVSVMNQISWIWASLPPGRYGQPSYSMAATRAEYCRLAGCDGQSNGPRCVNNPGVGNNCGDESVIANGDASTLYRCNGEGAASKIASCAYGCQHNPPGVDDACKPPPPTGAECVNNPGVGDNCGDESVIAHGAAGTLYHCNGAGPATTLATCAYGCAKQPPGVPDTCYARCVNNPGVGDNCGDESVIAGGRSNTLYRCNGAGAATILRVCTSGCRHNPPGVDDACN